MMNSRLHPIIHNVNQSNFANQMIKYMVAYRLAKYLGGARLSSYSMKFWNIDCPDLSEPTQRSVLYRHDADLDFNSIFYYANTGMVDRFDLRGHLQKIENYPARDESASLFVADPALGVAFGEGWLVCPIRGGEVLNAIHPGYTLLPLGFYEDIQVGTGLRLAFIGQIEDNAYCWDLRSRFKDALFMPSQGALADFQTIRKSKNIVVCISTFAWLAAWLSDASRIFLPAFGLFNKRQFTGFNFLPISDPRYTFFQFPKHDAVPVADYAAAHALIEGQWHETKPNDFINEVLG